jgi:hypothetical protein
LILGRRSLREGRKCEHCSQRQSSENASVHKKLPPSWERSGGSLRHAETGVLRDFDCVLYNKNKYKSKR